MANLLVHAFRRIGPAPGDRGPLLPSAGRARRGDAEVGDLLEPPKLLVVVPEERLRAVPGREPVELPLGPELLAARWPALVPCRRAEDEADSAGPARSVPAG